MPPKQQTKPASTGLPKKQPKTFPKVQPQLQSKSLPKVQPKQAPTQQSWLTRTTNAAASGVGSFAGAIVTAAGNGVAGAGKGAGSRCVSTQCRPRIWGSYI